MSTVQEIEAAISQLSPEELASVRAWLNQFEPTRSEVSSTLSPAELDRLNEMTPSQIQPPLLKTREARLAALRTWRENHADVKGVADDSRDSIYD
jgi:hypothetical protein